VSDGRTVDVVYTTVFVLRASIVAAMEVGHSARRALHPFRVLVHGERPSLDALWHLFWALDEIAVVAGAPRRLRLVPLCAIAADAELLRQRVEDIVRVIANGGTPLRLLLRGDLSRTAQAVSGIAADTCRLLRICNVLEGGPLLAGRRS